MHLLAQETSKAFYNSIEETRSRCPLFKAEDFTFKRSSVRILPLQNHLPFGPKPCYHNRYWTEI